MLADFRTKFRSDVIELPSTTRPPTGSEKSATIPSEDMFVHTPARLHTMAVAKYLLPPSSATMGDANTSGPLR
eukprot:1014176-Rhodomonas_salina.1